MIVDSMERIGQYADLLPHAQQIALLWQSGQLGKTQTAFEVRDKEYETKADNQRRFEVHAHTIDLMIGLSGEEIIHVCSPEELTPAEALPGGADGMKLDGAPCGSAVRLRPGCFVALYPGEAHMVGGRVNGQPQRLHKLVVKLEK